jgi:hypothetical protein
MRRTFLAVTLLFTMRCLGQTPAAAPRFEVASVNAG